MKTMRILLALCCITLIACTQEVVITQPIEQESQPGTENSDPGSLRPIEKDSGSQGMGALEEMKQFSSSIPSISSTSSIPSSVRIAMDFAPQAPTGNWDPPYDEACEEASLIIVHHYLEQTPLNAEVMDQDIQSMVADEESMGLPIDINMQQLAGVAEHMFGYRADVIEGNDVTISRIEQEIAMGNPVIVPLAGQDIGNPYYSGDGPPYHALVIIGYNDTEFITHDVGTKRGENYAYDKDIIMSALHDWNGSNETIRSGPKRMLVVKK